MPDLSDPEITVFFIAGGVAVVLLCIAAAVLAKKRRHELKSLSSPITLDPSRPPLRVHKIPAYTRGNPPDAGRDTDSPLPRPKVIDCITGRANLSESLAALAEKYSMDEITLATADGLLLASSQKSPSADAVAWYAGLFAENVQPRPPGIILYGLEHKGSFLVGIAKAGDPPVRAREPDLIRDTKDILNRWI